jgi:neutral trehalase
MVVLTTEEQEVVTRFLQLSPERRRHVMAVMFGTDEGRWQHYQKQGEAALRERAAERGLDWDQLDDEQRQTFVTELLHDEPGQ